jgi:hypothetical protein
VCFGPWLVLHLERWCFPQILAFLSDVLRVTLAIQGYTFRSRSYLQCSLMRLCIPLCFPCLFGDHFYSSVFLSVIVMERLVRAVPP